MTTTSPEGEAMKVKMEIVRLVGMAQLGIGLAALCGRILKIRALYTPWPFDFGEDPGMAFTTAVGFMLGGVAFFILARRYDK